MQELLHVMLHAHGVLSSKIDHDGSTRCPGFDLPSATLLDRVHLHALTIVLVEVQVALVREVHHAQLVGAHLGKGTLDGIQSICGGKGAATIAIGLEGSASVKRSSHVLYVMGHREA